MTDQTGSPRTAADEYRLPVTPTGMWLLDLAPELWKQAPRGEPMKPMQLPIRAAILAIESEAQSLSGERGGIDADALHDLDMLTRRIYETAQYHVEHGRNGPDIPRSMHRSRGEDEMKWADELRLILARLSTASEPGEPQP